MLVVSHIDYALLEMPQFPLALCCSGHVHVQIVCSATCACCCLCSHSWICRCHPQALQADIGGSREGEPGEHRERNLLIQGLIAFLNREACEYTCPACTCTSPAWQHSITARCHLGCSASTLAYACCCTPSATRWRVCNSRHMPAVHASLSLLLVMSVHVCGLRHWAPAFSTRCEFSTCTCSEKHTHDSPLPALLHHLPHALLCSHPRSAG